MIIINKMAELEKSYMQNVSALNNTNIPTNLNTLKGMIGKINNQIKTWNNNFKLSTTNYINNINDENIMNFINIYKKAQETYNKFNNNLTLIHGHINKNTGNNNILEGLYSNSENSLKIFQKRIEAQKASFITNLNIYINKTYNQTLKNYTESLNNTVTQLNGLKEKFDALILSNNLNLTNINNTYKSITPNKLKNNKPLKNSFNKLKSSLTNFATINTQNTNSAFATYNTLYQTTSNILKKNKSNMNIKIQVRIKKLNSNINTKTNNLNTLIASINAKISGLKNIINKNTSNVFKFSNKQKDSLVNIIVELNTSIKDSNATFVAENDKLKDIVASLRKIIGNAAGATANINSNRTLANNSERIGPNTGQSNTANQVRASYKNIAGQAAAKAKANTNAKAIANANAQIKNKKMRNLTNSNKNRPFTYQTKKGPIKATYIGKNNQARIQLKTKNPNGSNHKESYGKNATTILNKNIVFNT